MPPFTPYYSKDYVIEGSFLRLDDKEKAWEEIDGRMRTAIRKAQKSDVEIKKVKGTPEEMKAFCEFCLNPDDLPEAITDRYHVYFAYLKEELIAGIVLVEVGNKLFMLCHASTDIAKKNEIPSLLIWHMVEEFSGGKYPRLDIGASFRHSLQKFFSGWRTEGYPMIMKSPELAPSLMLTPFDTQSLGEPIPEQAGQIVQSHLAQKFASKPYTFFPRAMYAIYSLIKFLCDEEKINRDGTVYITTTTDTHFVSSCVTSAIEQTMPWEREMSEKTAAIFAIHEFGFPHPRLEELRAEAAKRNILLIEDCAYAWSTEGTGHLGDYAIYSLTKRFPLQFGGYLVGHEFSDRELWDNFGCSDRGKREYTEARLASWLQTEQADMERRRSNYEWYANLFGKDRTYFDLPEGVEPGAFILDTETEERMEEVGNFVRNFGIECGNYWQNHAIILPVHQRLQPGHLEYIAGSVLATEREWCGVPRDS